MAREYPRPLKEVRANLAETNDDYAAILDRLLTTNLLDPDASGDEALDAVITSLMTIMHAQQRAIADCIGHISNIYAMVLPRNDTPQRD